MVSNWLARLRSGCCRCCLHWWPWRRCRCCPSSSRTRRNRAGGSAATPWRRPGSRDRCRSTMDWYSTGCRRCRRWRTRWPCRCYPWPLCQVRPRWVGTGPRWTPWPTGRWSGSWAPSPRNPRTRSATNCPPIKSSWTSHLAPPSSSLRLETRVFLLVNQFTYSLPTFQETSQ